MADPLSCPFCGYPINPEAANHPSCVNKRIADLEGAIKKAVRHADSNGMKDWPVFKALRKAICR